VVAEQSLHWMPAGVNREFGLPAIATGHALKIEADPPHQRSFVQCSNRKVKPAVAFAKILLVDDDELLLSLTAGLLEGSDFEVVVADSVSKESRMLQVSIFETLKRNMAILDFSVLLDGIMTIADEVDSQLAQALTSYIEESELDLKPA
jgi:hypothetical protein